MTAAPTANAIEAEIVPKFALRGRKITFVDQRDNFVDAHGKIIAARVPDKVHPDQRGYDLMGRRWAREILSESVSQQVHVMHTPFNATGVGHADAWIASAGLDGAGWVE